MQWCKGSSLVGILVITIFLTCCQWRSRSQRIITVFVGSCPVSTVFSSRTVYTERTNSHPQSGSGAGWKRGSCSLQDSIEKVLFKDWSILMMSDYEVDLDDFPILSIENSSNKAESLVGAYRAESTDQWTAASGINAEMPPLLNWLTSGFRYEEQIDDWLDLTVAWSKQTWTSTEKQTCRRCGNAQGTPWTRSSSSTRIPLVLHGFHPISLHWYVSLNYEIRRSHSALDSGNSRIFPTHSAESENT